MELEEAVKRFNVIKEEYNRFDGLTEYVEAMDFILTHLTKQDKMIELLIEDLQGEGCLNMSREEIDNFYERRMKLAEEAE